MIRKNKKETHILIVKGMKGGGGGERAMKLHIKVHIHVAFFFPPAIQRNSRFSVIVLRKRRNNQYHNHISPFCFSVSRA